MEYSDETKHDSGHRAQRKLGQSCNCQCWEDGETRNSYTTTCWMGTSNSLLQMDRNVGVVVVKGIGTGTGHLRQSNTSNSQIGHLQNTQREILSELSMNHQLVALGYFLMSLDIGHTTQFNQNINRPLSCAFLGLCRSRVDRLSYVMILNLHCSYRRDYIQINFGTVSQTSIHSIICLNLLSMIYLDLVVFVLLLLYVKSNSHIKSHRSYCRFGTA